jgi:maltooligosyltrehalose trehalohydrolase
VTEGRRAEFRRFSAFRDPETRERIPDPQAETTFERSRLRWPERTMQPHAGVLALYRELLSLRRTHPALRPRDCEHFRVCALGENALALRRESAAGQAALLLVICFGGEMEVALDERAHTRAPEGREWSPQHSTEEERFGGSGRGGSAGGVLRSGGGAGGWVLGTQSAGRGAGGPRTDDQPTTDSR